MSQKPREMKTVRGKLDPLEMVGEWKLESELRIPLLKIKNEVHVGAHDFTSLEEWFDYVEHVITQVHRKTVDNVVIEFSLIGDEFPNPYLYIRTPRGQYICEKKKDTWECKNLYDDEYVISDAEYKKIKKFFPRKKIHE